MISQILYREVIWNRDQLVDDQNTDIRKLFSTHIQTTHIDLFALFCRYCFYFRRLLYFIFSETIFMKEPNVFSDTAELGNMDRFVTIST